jgi:general secretion pathway protein M
MNNLPEGPRGKALALGICFVLFALVYMIVIGPLLQLYQDTDERLQTRVALMQRLEVSARALPRLHAAADRLNKQPGQGAAMLTGSSAPVAGAELQSAVKEIVESNGAHLSSSEILAPEAADSFQKVGLHVSLSGDLTLLTAVLHGIETSHPVMFVDNVEIRGGANPGDDAQTLAIAFDVYGFRPS